MDSVSVSMDITNNKHNTDIAMIDKRVPYVLNGNDL